MVSKNTKNSLSLSAENIFFSYAKKAILQDVTLQVYSGEYISIIGPNGVGKSTLLKLIMRILNQSSGDFFLFGDNVTNLSQSEIAKLVSFVPQNTTIRSECEVYDLLRMSRYPYQPPFRPLSKSDYEIIDRAIELTNISELKNRVVRSLSGGERQAVLVAAALSQDSPLILLDEPLTFLDPHNHHMINSLLKKINDQGKTIICVTHDINSAIMHNSRIVSLKNGKLFFDKMADDASLKDAVSDLFECSFYAVDHPEIDNKLLIPGEM